MGAFGINTRSTAWFGGLFQINMLQNFSDKFLSKRVISCSKCTGWLMNFVAVDFDESSSVLSVIEIINADEMV